MLRRLLLLLGLAIPRLWALLALLVAATTATTELTTAALTTTAPFVSTPILTTATTASRLLLSTGLRPIVGVFGHVAIVVVLTARAAVSAVATVVPTLIVAPFLVAATTAPLTTASLSLLTAVLARVLDNFLLLLGGLFRLSSRLLLALSSLLLRGRLSHSLLRLFNNGSDGLNFLFLSGNNGFSPSLSVNQLASGSPVFTSRCLKQILSKSSVCVLVVSVGSV